MTDKTIHGLFAVNYDGESLLMLGTLADCKSAAMTLAKTPDYLPSKNTHRYRNNPRESVVEIYEIDIGIAKDWPNSWHRFTGTLVWVLQADGKQRDVKKS